MNIHQDRPASSGQWLGRHDLLNFITTLYEGDLHAKRVLSLANATVGVLTSASLAIHAVGRGLAQAMGTLTKHGVKQKANTVKRRTHSLFRQGLMLYHHLPNWPEDRVRRLMETFGSMLMEQRVYREVFGVI